MKFGHVSPLLLILACGDSTKAPATPSTATSPSPPTASASDEDATDTAGGGTSGSVRETVVVVNGKLSPVVVKRVVRRNFTRLLRCYDDGLKTDKTLAGRASVKFVIDEGGAVSQAADGGSELHDPHVVSCIVKSFEGLSFPKPESGVVAVVYPMVFAPPSDASKK
jgi:hypothetical protein